MNVGTQDMMYVYFCICVHACMQVTYIVHSTAGDGLYSSIPYPHLAIHMRPCSSQGCMFHVAAT
jgi:hypothetical protein